MTEVIRLDAWAELARNRSYYGMAHGEVYKSAIARNLDEAALVEALKAIDDAKRRDEPYGYVIKRPEDRTDLE